MEEIRNTLVIGLVILYIRMILFLVGLNNLDQDFLKEKVIKKMMRKKKEEQYREKEEQQRKEQKYYRNEDSFYRIL